MSETSEIPQTFLGTITAARGPAEVAALVRRHRETVHLQLDGTVQDQLADLREAHDRAVAADEETNAPDRAPELARRITELERAAEATRQKFTFQALENRRYQKLLDEYPATAAQTEETRRIHAAAGAEFGPEQVPGFDRDAFPMALCQAMAIEPAGPLEQWEVLWEQLSTGQQSVLFNTAFSVQFRVPDAAPKSAGG